MRPGKTRYTGVRSEVVILDGGLNESVSSLELKGGELIESLNYEIVEGSYGGYRSIAGFERFDGQTKPSSISATEDNHTAQDAARADITQVPGQGYILGIHLFKGKLFAFRNKIGGVTAGMYIQSSSGWVEIDTSSDPLAPNGEYYFVNYNFFGTTATDSMFWVDGENKARVFDGTTVSVIDNSGMDPNDKPINIAAHSNRLFLAYRAGSLQYSNLGDPTDWTTGTGEIGIGKEIVSLKPFVGNSLIIFCRDSIKVLNGFTPDNFELSNYSERSGAIPNTAKRMLGTVIFTDDWGVTTLTAVDSFGDFEANTISQKVKNTLIAKKSIISCATVSRILNQYRLYFSDGTGLILSFKDKKLRGSTFINLGIPIKTVCEGFDESGEHVIYFTSNSNYVYQLDSGTSFDGNSISTKFKTAFYHYGRPLNWKRFNRAVIELATSDNITVTARASFDYDGLGVPKSISYNIPIIGTGARYGSGIYGTSVYSGAGSATRAYFNILGLGSNMSMEFSTIEKYKGQHTIQNFITEYSLLGRQM